MEPFVFLHDFFISYSNEDLDFAKKLHTQLSKSNHDVFLAPESISLGTNWVTGISDGQRDSRISVFLISQKTATSTWVMAEIAAGIKLTELSNEYRVVPIFLEDITKLQIPYPLHIFQGIKLDELGIEGVAFKLSDLLNTLLEEKNESVLGQLKKGVGPRDIVFNHPEVLTDVRVIAAELLKNPIDIGWYNDKLIVKIDRREVDLAVYTTQGKNWLCGQVLKGEVESLAKEMDKEIHELLSGNRNKPPLTLNLHNLPLRWVSGGVLSVITIRGKESEGKWTPFFFRDIAPIGWNIALGSSENNEELNDPWSFLYREFLEETLVHSSRNGLLKTERYVKKFVLETQPGQWWAPLVQADHFAQQHMNLRKKMDGIDYMFKTYNGDYRNIITCTGVPTDVIIDIRIDNAPVQLPWANFLICFNLLELGIEVIKILEYVIDQNDEILDGEILNRKDANYEWQELVRMPVVLISHKYLKKVFNSKSGYFDPIYPEIYHSKNGIISSAPEKVKQPSVIPSIPLTENDVIIFHRDAQRRKEIFEILTKNFRNPMITEEDKRAFPRHSLWMKNFHEYFFDNYGNPISTNPPPWFTFTSAKVLSYYFGNQA
jgi:hypothetical protein